MPKIVKHLTVLEIQSAEPGMHADGGGLYLRVQKSGSKGWILRYQVRVGDKLVRREMGLGTLKERSATEARAEAKALAAVVKGGGDAIAHREAQLAEQAAKHAVEQQAQARKATTFADCAREYIKTHSASWRNKKHRAQWTSTLETYAYPVIGAMPVGEVTREDVRRLLAPIWTTKSETAERLRGRIEKVLGAAKVQGLREGDNPAAWKENLDALLAKPQRRARVVHHPALPAGRAREFLAALREVGGQSARAIEFAILTAARSGEVRGAKWIEFNLDDAVWIIPKARMKAGREHRIPLSDAALALIKAQPRVKESDYVFPAPRGGMLSDMALSMTVRRMNGLGEVGAKPVWVDVYGVPVVPHGFRATFREWAGEISSYPRDVIEHALAHQLPDEAEAAYARGTSTQTCAGRHRALRHRAC
ncbi:MAG: tyrosine-type recombinase/integrase [Burkholderiales bacterium]|nr:tyrosine-type recombinase/integrase [Burkholderiales bacterium]MBK8666271.1 tyrosine-type recombinase/integrase [Burkholderiales bacterium]